MSIYYATTVGVSGWSGSRGEPLRGAIVPISHGYGATFRWLHSPDLGGTIANNNRVMIKPEPTAPEVPYAGARVRLHRLLDGYCAWHGLSDADGYYWPRGLEVGLAYYPVAIDLTGQHECDAAGPVIAVKVP